MRDIICFSMNNWEGRKARKQLFMKHLSERSDVGKVLYVEPPLNLFKLLAGGYPKESKERTFRALSGNPQAVTGTLLVYTPLSIIPWSYRWHLAYRLNAFFTMAYIRSHLKQWGIGIPYVLWLYHPYDECLLEIDSGRSCSVFDWVEDWPAYFFNHDAATIERMRKTEERIIRNADIVLTVAGSLLQKALKLNPNSVCIEDGTDPAVFNRQDTAPAKPLLGRSKPILGYLGSLGHRVDYALLEALAKAMPEATLCLVGAVDPKNESAMRSLQALPNVLVTGMQPYDTLGSFAREFDICLLPYLPEKTLNFPTKLFDYFATGKPVVSTDIGEVRRFSELVSIAATREEFITLVRTALAGQDPQICRRRVETAERNTWKKRSEEIMQLLQTLKP